MIAFDRGGDLSTIRSDGSAFRRLLRDGYDAAWSPDGSRIAFVWSRSGNEDVWDAPVGRQGLRVLT